MLSSEKFLCLEMEFSRDLEKKTKGEWNKQFCHFYYRSLEPLSDYFFFFTEVPSWVPFFHYLFLHKIRNQFLYLHERWRKYETIQLKQTNICKVSYVNKCRGEGSCECNLYTHVFYGLPYKVILRLSIWILNINQRFKKQLSMF